MVMSNNKITKLNQYFYMTPEGEIFKYKKYCLVNNCKKMGSFNYSGQKDVFYCNDHKLDKMINVKKGYVLCKIHDIPYLNFCKKCQSVDCLLCNEKVNKNHFYSKKHIDNFNKNITIRQGVLLKRNLLI